MLALIGGTGMGELPGFTVERKRVLCTRYGEATVLEGRLNNIPLVFLPRHGEGHTLPPHRINYRANMLALQQCGVTRIIATAAVGSLNPTMKPGDFVLISDFIDFTRERPLTIFDRPGEVVHTDFTHAYCPEIRHVLERTAESLDVPVHFGGTYLCADGPRYETPAEIRMFAHWGADVVGMTGVPEVVFARELRMCYATVAIVTNWAAGISPSRLSHEEVVAIMASQRPLLLQWLSHAFSEIPEETCALCAA
ncbi:MAG: methylthioadenosine phosphorylase [Armatimonadota bacterium]|nr:MAG: methylthioadenosine phosphorylase [Armatimonadota bacterium]